MLIQSVVVLFGGEILPSGTLFPIRNVQTGCLPGLDS